MNEIDVSVSSPIALGGRRLALIRINRRFLVCCTLCAAVSQLLIENSMPEDTQPASRSALKVSQPPPLQIPPLTPSPIATADTPNWHLAGEDFLKARTTRWEKFESEFGIVEPEHSTVLRSVQSAKYNLDRLVFAADEFSHNLSSMSQYELDHGRLYHVSSDPPPSAEDLWPTPSVPRNVRLGLDVNVSLGRPYVGLKLVIPFGD